jgi:hypothetical protein
MPQPVYPRRHFIIDFSLKMVKRPKKNFLSAILVLVPVPVKKFVPKRKEIPVRYHEIFLSTIINCSIIYRYQQMLHGEISENHGLGSELRR